MGQHLQSRRTARSLRPAASWRSNGGQNLWLSMLVDTMEKFSRPELRAVPCDILTLAAVHAHLARPAATYLPRSHFGLRN
jgi:hypothetical protein